MTVRCDHAAAERAALVFGIGAQYLFEGGKCLVHDAVVIARRRRSESGEMIDRSNLPEQLARLGVQGVHVCACVAKEYSRYAACVTDCGAATNGGGGPKLPECATGTSIECIQDAGTGANEQVISHHRRLRTRLAHRAQIEGPLEL